MPELDLDDLAIFVRVVDHGGFAGAARELGTPTSTVSRAIGRLESRAGVRLVQRTTRFVRPTSEGRELYASIAPAVATLHGAARALEPAARRLKGRVRITAPNDICATFLAEVIPQFLERHPLVDLDFTLSNEHQNLVASGFDLAIRATARLGESTLVQRKLGDLEHRLYASPAYLERHGTPAELGDLERHQCVLFRAQELARTWALRSSSSSNQATNLVVRGRVGGDDFSFVRAVVASGGGIGLLPHVNTAKLETAGLLVRVLPEFSARGASLYLLYPSAKNVPARVTAFRDFVIEAFTAWERSTKAILF